MAFLGSTAEEVRQDWRGFFVMGVLTCFGAELPSRRKKKTGQKGVFRQKRAHCFVSLCDFPYSCLFDRSIVGSSSDEEVSAIGTSIIIDCGFILRDRVVLGGRKTAR